MSSTLSLSDSTVAWFVAINLQMMDDQDLRFFANFLNHICIYFGNCLSLCDGWPKIYIWRKLKTKLLIILKQGDESLHLSTLMVTSISCFIRHGCICCSVLQGKLITNLMLVLSCWALAFVVPKVIVLHICKMN